MNKSDIRKLVSESQNKDWLNELDIIVNFHYVDIKKNVSGISSIHNFFSEELENWNSYEGNLPNELDNSKKYYQAVKTQIEGFLSSYAPRKDVVSTHLQSAWNNVKRTIDNLNQKPLIFDDPKTVFLIDINNKHPNCFKGAYSYIYITLPSFVHSQIAENCSLV